MIVTKNNYQPGQVLTTDICIIGSGPAAISMALSLSSSPCNIIVVSGGGWSETVGNQDLNRGVVSQAGSHEPLEENRRRQFGGTSAAWGGRCIPFEPIDFKKRSWVPDSGWPFSFETLDPYYKQAAELCQIGDYDFDAHTAFPANPREIIPGLDSEEFISSPLERWSPPVNFAKTYRSELERSKTIQVLLDAQVIRLNTLDGSDQVSTADVSMGGSPISIQANTFVLAAGGIENPRLLLASTSAQFPTGLGNQHDNVGRYYMAHLKGVYAEVDPANRETFLSDFERDAEGVYCRRRWWIPEKAQEAHKLLNSIFFLYLSNSIEGHRDVLFSSRYVVKGLLSIASQRSARAIFSKAKQVLPSIKEHAVNIATNGLSQLPDLIRLSLKRMAKRRLPYILPAKNSKYWGLYFQTEQAPNRDSRVYLSATEKDAFGVPRAEVSIAFLEADVESVVAAHTLFIDNFRQKNLGEVLYSEEGLRDYLTKSLRTFNSGAHHIGTTRMSDDPETGVVDRNAKVYGLSNLYVAGASVFPTGGHANPTFTIVAHALLLADHLKSRIDRKPTPELAINERA
ncbi:GMC oxidoreductase [Spirosoma agri]|uniref:GMC family oxidoreductase n=1 Tax=Spirosoma agri TaxID=1987381 RepID=A0A6M0IMS6_9BACT|nr:GMC family oxidoreductase [Spirosoma agri]NEU69568.1 GMC family oxidoreductase [Spirosoma agri]